MSVMSLTGFNYETITQNLLINILIVAWKKVMYIMYYYVY